LHEVCQCGRAAWVGTELAAKRKELKAGAGRADEESIGTRRQHMGKALLVMLVCAFGFGAAAAGGHETLAFWLFLGTCSGLMVYTEKAAEEKTKGND
jgi:hypothetical protein